MKLMDNSRHYVQNFGLPGVWDVSVVVKEDSLKQRRDYLCIDHLQIVRFFDIGDNQLQDFFLDGAQSSDFWSLRGDISY